MGWRGHVARTGKETHTWFWWGNPNRHLERFTHRLEGKFKMDLEEIRWQGTDRFILLKGRTGGRLCTLGTEPIGSIKWE